MAGGMAIAVKPSCTGTSWRQIAKNVSITLLMIILLAKKIRRNQASLLESLDYRQAVRVSSAHNNRSKLKILSSSGKTDTYTQVNHRMSSLHK